MNVVPSISLLDLSSNEKHSLSASDCVVGRNWLKCDDKRISRTHGVLKLLSQNSITLVSTHENPLFYRKKDDPQISQINKGNEVNLFVGDSFGLLVDKFWFSVHVTGDEDDVNGNMVGNGSKRRGSADSEPDSTTKRVKTEPNEFQDDDAEIENNTTILTNGRQNVSSSETNNEMPSTSNQSVSIPHENPNSIGPVHRPIKEEPVDPDENEAQPMPVTVKNEPQDGAADSTNTPIKTEIKDEPVDDGAAATSSSVNETAAVAEPVQPDQPAQPAQRECCRYGTRCYRRNPAHKADEAHPGDTDYRLPDYPDPPLGAPPCPFLDRCYRRNPLHFQQFSHKTNLRPTKKKDGYEATAQTPNQAKTANYAHQHDDDEEESDEDPFATNGDSSDDFADPGSASDSDDAFDADTDEDDTE